MPLPVQELYPGYLDAAISRELQKLADTNAVERLWNKDFTLWPKLSLSTEINNNQLDWLDLPDKLGPTMERVADRSAGIGQAGFENFLFVAMGASNIAAEAVLHFGSGVVAKKFLLLDTINPDAIHAIEKNLDLKRTLFIFANKTGKHLETHAILLYYMEKLKSCGVVVPAKQFIAVTEQQSYLVELATQYKFFEIFLDPPGISSRFSSLIHFSLLLAAVTDIPTPSLLALSVQMREACGPSTAASVNPALPLAALLAAGEQHGLDKLILMNSPRLNHLDLQIGNLVGLSTARRGHGIIPIFGETSYPVEMFQKGCMVVVLKQSGDTNEELEEKIQKLRAERVPTAVIELHGPEEFGVELFKWEVATALSCSLLGVNPFAEANVQQSNIATLSFLQDVEKHQKLSVSPVRIQEEGIELYMEGETRQHVSTMSLQEALRTFFELATPENYLGLLPFLPCSESLSKAFGTIREQLVDTLRIPVLVTSGPRYLHSLGRVYKEGPAKGLFLFLTAEPKVDIPVPGTRYSFAQLEMALACGDFESLVRLQRPTLRLHFRRGLEEGFEHLQYVVKSALANIRRRAR